MSDAKLTLLPPTAPDLAKALDMLENRLFGLPVHLISKDPDRVSPELLDHLAWEYSVDVWGPDIPLETRRRIVASSPEIHRYKGTVHGIREALAVFGFRAEITEWWQYPEPRTPGTFTVSMPFDQDINRQLQLAQRVIERNMPASRGFSLAARVDLKLARRIGAVGFARLAETGTPDIGAKARASRKTRTALTRGHIQGTAETIVRLQATCRRTVAIFARLEAL